MNNYAIPQANQFSLSDFNFGGNSGLGIRTPQNLAMPNLPPNNLGTPAFSLGMNLPTLGVGLQGLNALGSLWGAFQARGLARDQLSLARDTTNTNLTNQIQSYNTALEDRARARGVQEGRSAEETQAYIDRNRLSR